jgi:F-type H+-transporting ATPase subunit b
MTGQSTDIVLLAQATTTAPATGTEAATGTETPAGEAAGAAATHTEVGTAESHVGFPPFEAATFGSQLLWLVITFGALYLITARSVVPRLSGILAKRRDTVEGDLAEADRLRAATDTAIADDEAALAAARA